MTFSGVPALTNVDFAVQPGEIRALIGANGAGKSTLMKILAGANPNYTGQVTLGGVPLELHTPRAAQTHGIRIVSQEVDTALIPTLSVAENIMMGDLHVWGGGFVNWNTSRLDAMIALKMLGCEIDVDMTAQRLSLAQKQMVLLARALAQDSRFLLLDEPTAPLSAQEIQKLFAVIRRLAKTQKVGIVLISHRLQELLQVCETMTVLRSGRLVKTFLLDEEVTESEIVRMMSGREAVSAPIHRRASGTETVLEVQGLCDAENKLRDVSFTVNRGEIVGIGGLAGAGKTELCRAIFGALICPHGSIRWNGKVYRQRSPRQSVKAGIALIPEERRREGIWAEESLCFNLTSCVLNACTGKFGFLRRAKEREAAAKMTGKAGIQAASLEQQLKYLSGGNQQKAVIGKWLLTDASLFLFDEATKGVDVAAQEEIFALLRKLADSGKSILYLSSELGELPRICDRVYVLYRGKIQTELRDTNREQLLYYAAGGGKHAI